LTKLKIDEMKMNQWIENIRKWISLTILSRFVEEIDKINEILVKMGYIDSLIGGQFFNLIYCLFSKCVKFNIYRSGSSID